MKSILNVHSYSRLLWCRMMRPWPHRTGSFWSPWMLHCRGNPEHFEPHEVKEPEMDGELIDAILKPFLDRLPGVSDERDIDEPDADEEIVFRDPIVGGLGIDV